MNHKINFDKLKDAPIEKQIKVMLFCFKSMDITFYPGAKIPDNIKEYFNEFKAQPLELYGQHICDKGDKIE